MKTKKNLIMKIVTDISIHLGRYLLNVDKKELNIMCKKIKRKEKFFMIYLDIHEKSRKNKFPNYTG